MKVKSPIINTNELKEIISKENVLIFDVRIGPSAKDDYQTNHLEKAVYVDLNLDLAQIDDFKNGGRHPLPNFDDFISKLGDFGIDENSTIIIYDDKNGANAAARFWWMLKAVGHKNVMVLDGGFQAAENAGFPMQNGDYKNSTTVYKTEVKAWVLPQVWLDDVDHASKAKDFVIVDVREKQRYDGLVEPIDLVAGHIPNAINLPFSDNLDENGNFKSAEELRNLYSDLFQNYPSNKIIFHCGSGVTACHSLLALDMAGYEIPNLYVGSWSEWSRNKL